jgi:alpha-N-arabinofuranosidase
VNARHNHAALASIVLVAGALLFDMAGCKSGKTKVGDELAGVTQFVVNGSFEVLDGQNPRSWQPSLRRGAEATLAVDSVAHSGGRSVRISSSKGAEASWLGTVPIIPYSRYKLGGWIKTQSLVPGPGRGAQISIRGEDDWRTPPVSGTKDWTRVDVELDAGANDALEVTCLFGGRGSVTGQAWFDDVELTRLSGMDLSRPAVVIDTEKTGEPMSKYIYGQFIEHLGRCIYRGIWAEMLEDR